MTPQEIAAELRNRMRQLCRTDLLALCDVLGYKDVCREVHGPILEVLPKFPGGKDVQVGGKWEYRPFKEIWQLGGEREFLILYPRGHLKTTLVSQAFLIQCILNFPDIRILLSCATGDQVEKVVRAVKGIFQFNEDFRALFPEFCPKKSDDFGSRDQFIVPARKLARGEPTLFAVTVGKTIAGYHPDMIFHSDLVDKENVKTPGGITDVIEHFKYMNPLLERYSARDGYPATRGFTFVEGTPYDFGDLHNLLMKNPDWKQVVRAAADPYPPSNPEQILWPSRFPVSELERLRREMGDWMFSAQYLMKCIPDGDGLCDPKDVVFIPHQVIENLMPTMRLHCTIDLAGMEKSKSGDFTVLTVAGFDRDGRMYPFDIRCGKFQTEEVIEHIFDIHRRYPLIVDYKIEKEAHARVLLPFLKREMSKRGRFPVIVPIPRDNQTSKQNRIKGLRPWFRTQAIRFSQNMPLTVKQELLDEIAQFPSESAGVHDDILDTLADQMQNRDGGVTDDVVADAPSIGTSIFGQPMPRDRFLGFDEQGIANWLYGPDSEPTKQYAPTGIM